MLVFKYNEDKNEFEEATLPKNEQDYYIYDPNLEIKVVVDFGHHLLGILFLLRKYYDIQSFQKEDIGKYLNIINSFEIKGAYNLNFQYADMVSTEGNFYGI